MKVRYIGPGSEIDIFKTEDLTVGKIYEAVVDSAYPVGVNVHDDTGHWTYLIIKGKALCPFEEYVEIVEE